MTDFTKLNLNEKILHALTVKGYTNPTPIQAGAIPQIINGKDFLGIAQTGTGKTAAFALPILHLLAAKHETVKPHRVRALVLTPTRELAGQIADNIATYGKNLHLKYTTIFGGVSDFHQIKSLEKGVDILIATPGRLLDLTNQKQIDYSSLEILVLDEADRMLDMGFIDDVKKIISKLPKEKQTLFFSATMPPAIEGLANSILKNPVKIEVTPQSTTVEKIAQKVCIVAKSNKTALLKTILQNPEAKTVLIFCQMKHNVNRLSESLKADGFSNAVLHGNKSQAAREKALKSFRSGNSRILIATDIAARGIDVAEISHVINYELPRDIENYVHRIGRTARAGREGIAISLCDTSELKSLRAIEKAIGTKIPVDETHPFHGVEGIQSAKETGIRISRGSSREPRSEAKDGLRSGHQNFGKRISSSAKTRTDFTGDSKTSENKFRDSKNYIQRNSNRRNPRNDSDGNSFDSKSRSRRGSDYIDIESRREFSERGNVRRGSDYIDIESRREFSERRPRRDGFNKNEENKDGIFKKIFGGWKKKDDLSTPNSRSSRGFGNKNFSGKSNSYSNLVEGDRGERRKIDYAKKRPFGTNNRSTGNRGFNSRPSSKKY